MIDEMWMRGWAENHGRFSADLDRGFALSDHADVHHEQRRRHEAGEVGVRLVGVPGHRGPAHLQPLGEDHADADATLPGIRVRSDDRCRTLNS